MEGPYRDLGSGFARLTGTEGVRRGPSHINSVEDAFLELLRNSRDAGAHNIYVASSLQARRYRTLTVLDDGHGIPESYKDLIFEPGVTNRHLEAEPTSPTLNKSTSRGGQSLYHIKNIAIDIKVPSTANPTSVQITLDTRTLPERALQAGTRLSHSNLRGTAQNFLASNAPNSKLTIYYGSPATIIATLLQSHIIQTNETSGIDASFLVEEGERLGIVVSLRTIQRICRGEIEPVGKVVD
ncbi:MAG: ATP-binding protein, partial [Rubrobacteraceae bacterium]